MRAFRLILNLALFVSLFAASALAQEAGASEREQRLFAQIDSMLAAIERITGIKAIEPIPAAFMTREEVNELIKSRLDEESSDEEIRQEELFLKIFGFVDADFNLKEEIVDVMTEQAAALYDYKTKKLYVSSWASDELQEYALVHELAHAVADQHFDLQKFTDASEDFDGDLARSAVIEGQASWVMHEYAQERIGRSLLSNRLLAVAAASASRIEVDNYPVYSASPLYIRESLMFPYADGLMFQQAAIEELGPGGFTKVFLDPPTTTQHILDPKTWIAKRKPTQPKLPELRLKGFERSSHGRIGQLDHFVLLKQYSGESTARRLADSWRGAHYEILENEDHSRAVLRYVSEWADEAAAARFFKEYVDVCREKWTNFEKSVCGDAACRGTSETGAFVLTLDGTLVTALEGLPEDAIESGSNREVD